MKTDDKPATTVKEIIELAGGHNAIAERSAALGRPIEKRSIYNWYKSGIPEKYWPAIRSLCRISIERLHNANELIRLGEDAA